VSTPAGKRVIRGPVQVAMQLAQHVQFAARSGSTDCRIIALGTPGAASNNPSPRRLHRRHLAGCLWTRIRVRGGHALRLLSARHQCRGPCRRRAGESPATQSPVWLHRARMVRATQDATAGQHWTPSHSTHAAKNRLGPVGRDVQW